MSKIFVEIFIQNMSKCSTQLLKYFILKFGAGNKIFLQTILNRLTKRKLCIVQISSLFVVVYFLKKCKSRTTSLRFYILQNYHLIRKWMQHHFMAVPICSTTKVFKTVQLTDTGKDRLLHALCDLYKRQELCDVNIYLDSINHFVVGAHLSVLGALCDGPQGMRAECMRGNHWQDRCLNGQGSCPKPLVLKGLDSIALKAAIDFLYGITIEISFDNFEKIAGVAATCGMTCLLEECQKFLHENIQIDRACQAMDFAHMFGFKDLQPQLRTVILKNFKTCCCSDNNLLFLSFSIDVIEQLYSADAPERSLLDERLLFEAAVNWLEHNLSERATFKNQVLTKIRFCSIPAQYLAQCVETHPLIQHWEEGQRLIAQAYRHKAIMAEGAHIGEEKGRMAMDEGTMVLHSDTFLHDTDRFQQTQKNESSLLLESNQDSSPPFNSLDASHYLRNKLVENSRWIPTFQPARKY